MRYNTYITTAKDNVLLKDGKWEVVIDNREVLKHDKIENNHRYERDRETFEKTCSKKWL